MHYLPKIYLDLSNTVDINKTAPDSLGFNACHNRLVHNRMISFFLSLLARSYLSIMPGSANLEILIMKKTKTTTTKKNKTQTSLNFMFRIREFYRAIC